MTPEDHFGLTGRPFALTPDPDFWFESGTHRKAMAYLGYGLSQGEGFIVITGEVGSGKTTLVRRLAETVDSDRLRVITLVFSSIEATDVLRLVARELGVDGGDRAALVAGIEDALKAEARRGRRVLLIADEAQNLGAGAIEELRMLSNFQLGPDPLVQVFLLGQPELRERLAEDPAMEQVRQRVIATHHLGAMEGGEVGPYLQHRLARVGWTGRPDFSDGAVAAIDEWSGGLPRRVNALAARALLAAALDGLDVIDEGLIGTLVEELAGDAPEPAEPAEPVSPSDDRRIGMLEARVEAQDVALRHILKMLVDWVELEPPAGRLRGVA